MKDFSLAKEIAKRNLETARKPAGSSLAEEIAKRNPRATRSSFVEAIVKENSQFSNTSSGKLATALAQTRQNSKSV